MTETIKTDNQKFCHECGQLINIKAEICPKCGVRQASGSSAVLATDGSRTRAVALLVTFFFGFFGGQQFYLGKTSSGVIRLVFCFTFIPAILALIEFFQFLSMSDAQFNQLYNNH